MPRAPRGLRNPGSKDNSFKGTVHTALCSSDPRGRMVGGAGQASGAPGGEP